MSLLAATLLLVAMLAAHEGGRRLGLRRLAREEMPLKGTGTAQGAVFTMLGLLMAFTFHGAAGRFDERRHLATLEANAISSAYQRLDLLAPAARAQLREDFHRYLDLRVQLFAKDDGGYESRREQTNRLQGVIWGHARLAIAEPASAPAAPMLLLPALHGMFDLATERHAARTYHPPAIIYLMLGMLALLGSALAGFDSAESRRRSWFHILAFCGVIAGTTYMIGDLEFPRHGLIQIDDSGNELSELQRQWAAGGG
jgi:hypothetical protein